MWGWVRPQADQTGRAVPLLLGTAQPGLLFAANDLSFASVLPLATGRTRAGTAFGNVWKLEAVAARVMMLGCYSHPRQTSTLSWISFLPANPSHEKHIAKGVVYA